MPNPISYGSTMALLLRDQRLGPFRTFRHSKLNENWASVRRRMGAGGKKVELFRFSFVPTMNNNVSISACGGRKHGFGSAASWSKIWSTIGPKCQFWACFPSLIPPDTPAKSLTKQEAVQVPRNYESIALTS